MKEINLNIVLKNKGDGIYECPFIPINLPAGAEVSVYIKDSMIEKIIIREGAMKYSVCRNESHWSCNCNNTYFSITPTCIYCPNCGTKQRPYD